MIVRPAEPPDAEAVARLLYEPARGMYDLYAGGRERALAILRAAFGRRGNNSSREVVTVALADGAVAGVVAAFPASEEERRAAMFMRLTLAMTPPWRWPQTLRTDRAGRALTPEPPESSLYVDALAVDERFRRQGIARALLDEAERRAAERGLEYVALDTTLANEGARALYERAGFAETARSQPRPPIPAAVGYARRVATRT